ncbi:MAG: adenylate cyclase [Hyphomicrobiales bacterium]
MPSSPPNGESTSVIARRLAAIAFVDIVGYSILMARDETRTHQRWMTILNEVIRPQVRQHRGTIVKSTGDGILAEFPSAFDAVEWALEVQGTLHREADDGAGAPVALRIAVHLGDVITTTEDIYGDNVNLTARLQAFAEPGGIVLSETVFDLVRGSLARQARDLGLLELQNFEKPVRAFALDPAAQNIRVPFLARPARLPSIAVLPLQNIGGDPEQDYFSDGIVEDITLSLAGLREVVVISRGSTLAYRGRQPDPREVGRTLGVRYVLMGSVRKSERLMRVSVELCDADTGANLWGQKEEVPQGELFDIQDRLVRRIVAGIAPNVRAAELRAAMRKRPENFNAYDFTLRALHTIHSLELNTFLQARDYLNKAMEEDPNFAMPVAWAARWHSIFVGQGWSANQAQDSATAVELALKAIELDDQNALALATYGHLRSYLFHDYDSAFSYFDRALAACPNHSLAWLLSSGTLSYVGRSVQAVQHAEKALQLSPLDRSLFYYYTFLNLAHYGNGTYEQAVKWGKMSVSENPNYTANLRILTGALVGAGRVDEARDVAAQLLRLEPGFRVGVWGRTRLPFRDPEISEKYMEHLRTAGLPD